MFIYLSLGRYELANKQSRPYAGKTETNEYNELPYYVLRYGNRESIAQ